MKASCARAMRAPSSRLIVLPLCRSGVSVTTKVLEALRAVTRVWTL